MGLQRERNQNNAFMHTNEPHYLRELWLMSMMLQPMIRAIDQIIHNGCLYFFNKSYCDLNQINMSKKMSSNYCQEDET